METFDLPSDADTTKATVAINFPTESKSVKRRSCQRPVSHGMTHRRRPTAVVPPPSYTYFYSHSGIAMPGSMAGTRTMSRSRNYPYAMTLRLSSPMQSEVENLAYESRLSKAQFIRIALRRAIADAYDHATQNTHLHAQVGAL